MGLLAGIISAIGQTQAEFSGVRSTRVAQQAATGASTLTLERATGLPAPGKILLGGVTYRYDSISNQTLQNVGIQTGGVRVPGILAPAHIGDEVFDVSGTYSALDGLRRDIMVDTATGADLTAIGSNLGVPRDPNLPSDDQYRALIKVLAYGRRNTMQGLRNALDALLGPGHYTLTEDLFDTPHTVQVGISQAALASAGNFVPTGNAQVDASLPGQGRGYVSGRVAVLNNGNFFGSLPDGTYRVSSVILADEDIFTACDTALASTVDAAWGYVGQALVGIQTGSNGASATQISGANAYQAGVSGYYQRTVNAIPTAHVTLAMQFSNNQQVNNDPRQSALLIDDTKRVVSAGISNYTLANNVVDSTFRVGFIDGSGNFLSGYASFPTTFYSTFHTMSVKKVGGDYAQLYMDGALVQTLALSAFPASSATRGYVQAGVLAHPGNAFLLQNIAVSTRNRNVDYWNYNGTDGQTVPSTTQLQSASNPFQLSDVGHRLRISKSLVMNAFGGNNNGIYDISAFDGAGLVELACELSEVGEVGANASSFAGGNLANDQALLLPNNPTAFVYPDDLGKMVTLAGGSSSGNNGAFYISNLIDPVTGNPMIPVQGGGVGTFNTSVAGRTNIAILQPVGGGTANFVPQSNLTVTMRPNFVSESNLPFELSDAGNMSYQNNAQGTPVYCSALTRIAPPLSGVSYLVLCNTVLSAQVLGDHAPHNNAGAQGSAPPFWPLYAADPGSFVKNYLSQLATAGVQVVVTTY